MTSSDHSILAGELRHWAQDDVLGMRREVSMRSDQFVDVADLERWAGLMIGAADAIEALSVSATGEAEDSRPAASNEVLRSFDAMDWARSFVAHVDANPSIPRDEETMVTWFASALMRGYDEAAARMAPRRPADWLPSEALYAFAGWLTSRDERTVMSATDDAAPAADRVAEFCKRHSLPDPRSGWHTAIVHPSVDRESVAEEQK